MDGDRGITPILALTMRREIMKMLVVDARARRLASQLLADFLDAKITNDEYNDAFPASTIDPGLLNSNRRSFG